MNPYKMDWMLATQGMSDYIIDRVLYDNRLERSRNNDVTFDILENANQKMIAGAITWAAPRILRHLAQNQLTGKLGIAGRVGGRLGLRFVPIVGTMMLVKDLYDLYDYFDD